MVYLTPFGDEGPLGDDPPEDRAKEVQLAAKDEDEIKRFTVDENLGDIEKAILYLKGGHPWQQACAIESIPRLLRARKTQALEAIQKHLGAAIQTLEAEGQISLATMFTEVLKDRLLPPKELVSWIKPIVLKGTAANKTSEEHEAWMTALQELLPLLDVSALREVMSIALTSGSVEEDVQSRTRCCRLLGALARHMTPEDVERSFLKKVLALCQDTDYEVRICMCEQTATLGAAVGNDLTTKKLLPEVLELLKDEEVSVQTVAMTTLLDLVETLPTQTIKESVMPVLRLYMQPLDLEPEMQRCIAKIFGPMVVKIAPCFESETDSGLFFGCYRFLASRSEAQLRQDCARNFPGILKMASPKLYAAHFHDTFAQLAVDADDEVRRIIAAQFHEVGLGSFRFRFENDRDGVAAFLTPVMNFVCHHKITRMLEPDVCLQFLRPPLETLLKDTFPPVRAEIMKMLSTVLSRMHTSDQEQRHRALQSLVHPLVELSKLVGRDWRQDLNLAGALPRFVESFSSEAIFTCFVPIAFDRLANGAAAVKIAAADGVAAFLRHNKSEKQRTQIFVRIIREFARGKSVWSRMTFVDLSRHILRRFSTKFFKDHMLDYYIDLMHDPIPNVRLHSCSLLPNMKQTVKLPEDVDQLERLNSAMSNLMTDSDRDVSSTAREIHNAFKRMPVRMTGGAGVLDMNGMAAGQSEFEEEDRRKEEEEVDLTLAQEEIEQ
ncbi:hypothetical protein BSKO_07802 [Bryopsis sp. KO-2023]|nr:hypothetical protein BSKO_07802 [Bryopsis sp. KO-2023]